MTDEEVDMVMKEADVMGDGAISKMELVKATALWYGYVDSKKGGCCVVM